MTKDDIIALPNPHLRKKSTRIHVITDDIIKLSDDMIAAALDWEDSGHMKSAQHWRQFRLTRLNA